MAIQTGKLPTFSALQLFPATNKSKSVQMASTAIIQSCKQFDPKEELLGDLDAGISKMILTLGNLIEIKNKLTHIPNLIPYNFCSSLFEVTIEPTFPFQDFVHWIVKNYVKSNSQVLSSGGSHIICTINPDSIRR